MTKETSDRVSYAIAYDKIKQLVIVYPQWRGQRPNFQQIGEYKPENPRTNLKDYVAELNRAVDNAMLRAGQGIDSYKVTITPLDGTADIVAKDFGGPMED